MTPKLFVFFLVGAVAATVWMRQRSLSESTETDREADLAIVTPVGVDARTPAALPRRIPRQVVPVQAPSKKHWNEIPSVSEARRLEANLRWQELYDHAITSLDQDQNNVDLLLFAAKAYRKIHPNDPGVNLILEKIFARQPTNLEAAVEWTRVNSSLYATDALDEKWKSQGFKSYEREVLRGVKYDMAGEVTKAIDSFHAALDEDNRLALGRVTLAVYHKHMANMGDAAVEFRTAALLDPRYHIAMIDAAAAALDYKDPSTANELTTWLLQARPDWFNGREQLEAVVQARRRTTGASD